MRFMRVTPAAAWAVLLIVAVCPLLGSTEEATVRERPKAPEFPSLRSSSWSGPATSLESLRGHVVLLNVWTFG